MATFVVYLMLSKCLLCDNYKAAEWKADSYAELTIAYAACKAEVEKARGKPFDYAYCRTEATK